MNPDKLTNECPTVVGTITSCLESGGSMDTAARSVAENGPENSRRIFSEAVGLTDTKVHAGIADSLRAVMSGLPQKAAGYRRAVDMCISASESSTGEEMSRMLRDASDSSLESVRTLGETYGASLTFPCMAVFGIGIMVPMILMSLLPMMGIGGMFGAAMLDSRTIVLVTLVLIPAGILLLSMNVRGRNPFLLKQDTASKLKFAAPLLVAVPLALVHRRLGLGDSSLFLFAVAPAAIATMVLMYGEYRSEGRRAACEESMRDTVFDLGNRMLSGENFGRAACDSLMTRRECAPVGESLGRELELCRGNVSEALELSVGEVSPDVCASMDDIRRCSERDSLDAGKLAVTLGRQFQNRDSAMRGMESNLKSMTDMMFGTATVFAPMVLGLSVSMLKPLSEMSGYVAMEGTSTMLGAYLIELSALIALLTSSLGSGQGFCNGLWKFCIMCPIALGVFALCCQVSF